MIKKTFSDDKPYLRKSIIIAISIINFIVGVVSTILVFGILKK